MHKIKLTVAVLSAVVLGAGALRAATTDAANASDTLRCAAASAPGARTAQLSRIITSRFPRRSSLTTALPPVCPRSRPSAGTPAPVASTLWCRKSLPNRSTVTSSRTLLRSWSTRTPMNGASCEAARCGVVAITASSALAAVKTTRTVRTMTRSRGGRGEPRIGTCGCYRQKVRSKPRDRQTPALGYSMNLPVASTVGPKARARV